MNAPSPLSPSGRRAARAAHNAGFIRIYRVILIMNIYINILKQLLITFFTSLHIQIELFHREGDLRLPHEDRLTRTVFESCGCSLPRHAVSSSMLSASPLLISTPCVLLEKAVDPHGMKALQCFDLLQDGVRASRRMTHAVAHLLLEKDLEKYDIPG